MRRAETATIGRRLAQLRAPRTQREQAAALGVPERTYQTYEQDARDPDMRTLIGVFLQGWDLNWVLTGVGQQRLDPRAVVEWLVLQQYAPADRTAPARVAEEIAEKYAAGTLPVPPWVREEIPKITPEEALAIAHGSWSGARQERSQEVSGDTLSIAHELADEALKGFWLPRKLHFDLVATIYGALADGATYDEILGFARPLVLKQAGGRGNAGEEVAKPIATDPGRGAAAGG